MTLEETKLENRYIVFTEGGGMYENFVNIVRVYKNIEEAKEFCRGSSVYSVICVPYIKGNCL